MDNPDYLFGILTAEVKNLQNAVRGLTMEVKNLAIEVAEIKLFRSKVMGMSIGASLVASVAYGVILEVAKSWAR